jgi:hypothetical protein
MPAGSADAPTGHRASRSAAGQLAAYLLEGKEQAQVGAVLRPGREQREDRIEDVLDRACGVALDVRQQVLGLPVLLALGVERGPGRASGQGPQRRVGNVELIAGVATLPKWLI